MSSCPPSDRPDSGRPESFFVYGTLLDDDLRTLLTGPGPRTRSAVLAGFQRFRVAGADYPIIIPRQGGAVRGLLVDGLGPGAVERLKLYEGPDYVARAKRVTLDDGSHVLANVFVPGRRLVASAEDWDLEWWQSTCKEGVLRRLRQAY